MTTEPTNTRTKKMGEPDLSPTAQALHMARLEGRQNSLEQLVRESNESLRAAIQGLNGRLDKWFDDYEKNRDDWRRLHEAENEDDMRELHKEIRSVRESAIRWVSIGVGIGLVGASLVTGFLWALDQRFKVVEQDARRAEQRVDYQRQRIDKQQDEIYDLKLYLARGGRIPEQPYVPPSQREKGNED